MFVEIGAYLLSVLWSGQHVPGSPYKVSVLSSSDASKVVCSGDGLTSAVVGRDSSVLIDGRRAGCGKCITSYTGSVLLAKCSLLSDCRLSALRILRFVKDITCVYNRVVFALNEVDLFESFPPKSQTGQTLTNTSACWTDRYFVANNVKHYQNR